MTPARALELVRAGDRRALARTLSRCESSHPDDQKWLDEFWELERGSDSSVIRVAFTGVPGVGKSTLIEALGGYLLNAGRRVAVLAVDPSSELSGGSLLGDKTRMPRLASDPRAYVRPSASRSLLGGVAAHTQESIAVCELAGFDVIVLETVGVGQGESEVVDLVDVVVLLTLASAGDELQVLKRGITERADVLVVNKADGEQAIDARACVERFRSSLRLLRGVEVPAFAVSALEARGLEPLWDEVAAQHARWERTGNLLQRRQQQALRQFRRGCERLWLSLLRRDPARRSAIEQVEQALRQGECNLRQAVREAERALLGERSFQLPQG